MNIRRLSAQLLAPVFACGLSAQTSPTFTKDVAPILQASCQICHRPGEAAPFSLLTYEQARPWAKAIKEAVLMRKMPPWFADPKYGKFSNDASLQQKEIDTLSAWADAGAPRGNPKELPPPREFADGWAIAPAPSQAAAASTPRKKLLVIGEEKGYRHEAVSHAMATIERLGRETGLWDTVIRTDTEALTKKKLEYNAKNLNDFDAVLFYTGGTLEMDDQQKADFLSFVHDDGKGFIGVHSATITFTKWPQYGEMVGGYFDEHPWGTFDAPILVEDAAFPGMKQWAGAFTLKDEIYQVKNFSRENTRVLMRLDPAKLDLANPKVHRKDNDFAVSWAKMYGKGRVFYSTLGHVDANWDRPEMQKMYIEAIKWALRLVDADVTPRRLP